ncbi:MAG: carbonic anhydrase [Bacillota bacterium]
MGRKKPVLRYILAALLVIALTVLSGCSAQQKVSDVGPKAADTAAPKAADNAAYSRPAEVKTAVEAKQLLIDGNNRFVAGNLATKDLSETKREDLKKNGQKPFAVIVSCSDSRVPPELLFDQGIGDLFIIRVAGNVVDPVAMGSIEYAVEHLGSPLIVVMGHEKCGAVKATVDGGEAPGSIGSIVAKIKPAVDKAKAAGAAADQLAEKSADENVKLVMAEVEKSPVIKHLMESGKVSVVGAKYHIGGGQVEWFE